MLQEEQTKLFFTWQCIQSYIGRYKYDVYDVGNPLVAVVVIVVYVCAESYTLLLLPLQKEKDRRVFVQIEAPHSYYFCRERSLASPSIGNVA